MISRLPTIALALVIAAGCNQLKAQSNRSLNGFDLVDTNGNIRKPSGYRDHFQGLGSWTVLDPKGDEMHVVSRHLARPSITARQESSRTEPC